MTAISRAKKTREREMMAEENAFRANECLLSFSSSVREFLPLIPDRDEGKRAQRKRLSIFFCVRWNFESLFLGGETYNKSQLKTYTNQIIDRWLRIHISSGKCVCVWSNSSMLETRSRTRHSQARKTNIEQISSFSEQGMLSDYREEKEKICNGLNSHMRKIITIRYLISDQNSPACHCRDSRQAFATERERLRWPRMLQLAFART